MAAADVKLHGATGDGATDDTRAVQAALNAGVDVFFPAGTYVVSSALTLPSGSMRVYGAGMDISTIKFAAGGGLTMFDVTGKHDLLFSDLTLDANGNAACLLLHSSLRAKIHRVKCKNTTATALGLDQAGGGACHGGEILNCHFENIGNHGIYVSLSDACRVQGCFGTGIGFSGVDIAGGSRSIISGNMFDGMFAAGNGSGFGGIRLSNQCFYASVTGNVISGFTRGLMIIGSNFGTITGNVFRESNGEGILVAARVLGGGTDSNFNTITGNVVFNVGTTFPVTGQPYAGILITKDPTCNANGNIIFGNTIINQNPPSMTEALRNDTGQQNHFSTNVSNGTLGIA